MTLTLFHIFQLSEKDKLIGMVSKDNADLSTAHSQLEECVEAMSGELERLSVLSVDADRNSQVYYMRKACIV